LIIDNWREKNKYGILAKNVDIEDIVKDLHMKLEELSFKNETDLQQMLQSMLTPKEVFLNTVFLMQDSANIFQLAPAERLNVLKNVFNLLSIDEGKEVIAEKKREIYYKLKATADTSKYDDRLKQLLATYEETFTNLLDFKDYLGLKEYIDKNEYHDFISEINFIKEKVTITDFSLTNFPAHLVTDLE
jgi:DNA repair exonuclease SbcCD ATPase subunit